MSGQPVLDVGADETAVVHHDLARDDRVLGGVGPAPEQRLDRIAPGTRELHTLESPHHDVGGRPGREQPEHPFAAEALCATERRDLERLARLHRFGSAAEPPQQEGVARLHPERGRVGRRRPVAPEADGHAGVAELPDGGEPGADHLVRARTMRHARPPLGHLRYLGGVGVHAVGDPGAVAPPPDVLEVLERSAAVDVEAVGVLVDVLGEVGVQTHVESFGQRCGRLHQVGRDREGGTRRQRHLHHGVGGGVVVCADQPLRFGEDRVVVLHDLVGWEAAVLLRPAHRAAGGVEPHPQLLRRRDLGGDQVAGTGGVHVHVIHRRRASAEGEFGGADPCREVGRLLVDVRPDGVERREPAEQVVLRGRWKRAREVLVDVVMGVDQTRRHEAPGRVDDPHGLGFGAGLAHGLHPAAGHRDPPAGDLTSTVVHRDEQPRVLDDEFRCHRHQPSRTVQRVMRPPCVSSPPWRRSTRPPAGSRRG